MSSGLVPTEPSYSDWLDALDLDGIVSELTDLAEYLPYAKAMVGAYHWYRSLRAKKFLRALGTSADRSSPKDKADFQRVIRSKEGGEVLAQYVDTVLQTSSETAIAALALLYADTNNERHNSDFKVGAALALRGISEDEIDAFLDLSGVKDFIPATNQPNPPYPVAVVNDKLVASLPHARELLLPPETRVSIVCDLINRGLLLPDFASSRYSDGGVGLTFGVSDVTRHFADLLREARELLPKGQ